MLAIYPRILPGHAGQAPVIAHLMGGLGNQMFQYATGRALALRLGVPLKLDISWFASIPKECTERPYMLDAFSGICAAFATEREVDDLVYAPRGLLGRLLRRPRRHTASYVVEPYFAHWKGFEQLTAPVYISGYWQNEIYFKAVADAIRQDFAFPPLPAGAAEEMADHINATNNAVAVHIRRGDYESNPAIKRVHGLCSVAYYQKALACLAEHNAAQLILFLFSDDPVWVRNHFDACGHRTRIVDFPAHYDAPWHDMHLMSLCKHHVVANSSFSWWGAWMSVRRGLVCAPRRWFAEETKKDYTPAPTSWMVI